MALVKFQEAVEFQTEECVNCGLVYAVPTSFVRERRRDHRSFYCPNGHGQSYTGKSEEERLRGMLNEANARNTQLASEVGQARAAAEKAEKERKRIMKRAKAGVCPCCNRTFQNVARHMATKHRDASPTDAAAATSTRDAGNG